MKIFVAALTSLLALSCAKETVQEGDNAAGYRTIRIVPGSSATKSIYTDVTADDIWLYSFDGEGMPVGQSRQLSIADGVYTYNIPVDSKNLIFSNISDSNIVGAERDEEDGSFRFTPLQPSDEDMVACALKVSDIPADGSKSIHLGRFCAKLSVTMKLKDINKKELVLKDYIRSAGVRLESQYASYCIGPDGAGYYSGTASFECSAKDAPLDDGTEYVICSEMSVLPSPEGEKCSVMLTMTELDGGRVDTGLQELSYGLEANRHYRLTVSVVRDETGFGFKVEDIVKEEFEVELN